MCMCVRVLKGRWLLRRSKETYSEGKRGAVEERDEKELWAQPCRLINPRARRDASKRERKEENERKAKGASHH